MYHALKVSSWTCEWYGLGETTYTFQPAYAGVALTTDASSRYAIPAMMSDFPKPEPRDTKVPYPSAIQKLTPWVTAFYI